MRATTAQHFHTMQVKVSSLFFLNLKISRKILLFGKIPLKLNSPIQLPSMVISQNRKKFPNKKQLKLKENPQKRTKLAFNFQG
jgi:hypothetical protein